MKKSPSFLVKPSSSSCYHFRSVIPKDLVARLKQTQFQISLKTGILRQARQRASVLSLLAKTLFETIQQNTSMANLSLNEIKTILKAELEKYVLESNEDMLKINPYSKKEVEEEIEFTKTLKNLYRLGLESGDEKLNRIIDKQLEMIFEKNSIEMDTKSVDYRMLRMNFVKALEKQFEYKMELLSGEQQSVYDISDSIHDEVTSPQIESIASPPSNLDTQADDETRISDALEAFIKEKNQAGSFKEKTENTYRQYIELLIEVVGDIPMRNLNAQKARKFKETIIQLPANKRKIREYKNKSINEILSMNNIESMSVQTANNYLGNISSFIEWSRRNNYLEMNYFSGLKIKIKQRDSEEKDAFTLEDLMKIFYPDEYLKYTVNKRKNAYYWIPLIGVFTGARLTEISQLHLNDVKRDVSGIWYFDINEDTEDKSLKNLPSKRNIPIHPVLKELNFLEYVKLLNKKGEERLFPKLKKGVGGYKKNVGRFFNETLLKRSGVKTDKKSFHSFRHTVSNTLKQKRITETLVAELLGHSLSSETFGRYGKAYTPRVLYNDVVRKIEYKGVDWIGLKQEWNLAMLR